MDSQDQAALGASRGGLGFRQAKDVALPAFIAARVAALPFIKHIGQRVDEIGLMPIGFGHYVHDTYINVCNEFETKLTGDRVQCFS